MLEIELTLVDQCSITNDESWTFLGFVMKLRITHVGWNDD